jgi:hypothetical protein
MVHFQARMPGMALCCLTLGKSGGMAKRRRSDNDDDVAAFLQHELMNETKAYLERGRRFSAVLPDELAAQWVIAVRAWFGVRSDVHQRELDDLTVELSLRELPIPEDQIPAERAAMMKEIEQAGADSLSDEARQRISDFIASRRKPSH